MMTDWMSWPLGSVWAWRLSWMVVGAALVWWLWTRVASAVSVTAPHESAARTVSGQGWIPGCVAGLMAVLAVWPQGGWSGYAALAFQSPSLLSLIWAIALLLHATGFVAPLPQASRVPVLAWYGLCLLGWALTIDTLNLWPSAWDVSFYAWGFSAGSLWLSAWVVMALAWRQGGPWVGSAVVLLAMYATLRWPTGNVWDAWLDPVVWMVAHVQILRDAWRRLRQAA